MKTIIHKSLEKSKFFMLHIYRKRIFILKYLVFIMVMLFVFILGTVYQHVNSLRDNIELIYPELPKNAIIYLPDSERISIKNNYINLSNNSDINEPEQGIQPTAGQSFVASKNGSRFYPVDCKSASRIKPENKIYFNTLQDAEKAGYTLASGCSL